MLNFTVIIWQLYSNVFHFACLAGKDDESKNRKKKEHRVGFFSIFSSGSSHDTSVSVTWLMTS